MLVFIINTSLPTQKFNYFTPRYPCTTNHYSNFRTTYSSISFMRSNFIFSETIILFFLRFI